MNLRLHKQLRSIQIICLYLLLMSFVNMAFAYARLVDAKEVVVTKVLDSREFDYMGVYTVTAYCSCEICCGDWAVDRPNGIVYGAYGDELVEGVSCAAPLPQGTRLLIDGHEYVVQDTTADWIVDKYGEKIVDLYFDKHEDALLYGKKVFDVWAIKEGVD